MIFENPSHYGSVELLMCLFAEFSYESIISAMARWSLLCKMLP